MRAHLLLLTLALAAVSCHKTPEHASETQTTAAQAGPGTLPDIRMLGPLPNGEWTQPAGDPANTRFSPLAQITTANVQNLAVKSTFATGVTKGHEGNPLVVKNTMYVVTPFPNFLIAVDLTKEGHPIKWKYDPHASPRAVGVACCDLVNRGASYADGKIIYNTLDAHTVAVDAETGEEVWKVATGEPDKGETTTMAAQVAKDLVIVGSSGGELGVRGKVTALDVKTGRMVWRAYTTGSDADVLIGPEFKPFYPKDQGKDLGISTWTPEAWKTGGGNVWGWVSYDPELDVVYYGTGNPGPWNADLRPGDNKWTISIMARRRADGHALWAYQVGPNDAWDYDEINENVLVDMKWQGRMRKLLVHPGRTGFMFVLDRENGELLAADKFEPTNWASAYDLKTGKAKEDPQMRPHMAKVTKGICPSSTGAKEFAPTAFSPRTGLLYVPAHNTCMDVEFVDANYIAGTPYLGNSTKMYPGPGGYQGELIGWNVAEKRAAWSVKEEKLPLSGGVLATGGDVVFYGTMDGWFKALDARSGKELWKTKLASGVVGNPMTFVGPDGKQYVAIYAGVGGWMGAVAQPTISVDDPYAALGVVGALKEIKHLSAPGDVVYVFGL